MGYRPMQGAHKPGGSVELRTGTPYANLIAKQVLFAATLGERCGIDPDDILPTPGATGAIEAVRNHVLRSCGKTRPSVMTVCPGYWRARESFAGLGFDVKAVHTKLMGFSLDERVFISEAQKADADLIYLSLPNNPTGAIFDPDSIIEGIPHETPIALDMTLPGRGLSMKSVTARLYKKFKGRQNLFLIGSTSKSHATAEFRIGWLVCTHPGDAIALKHENRNAVASVGIDRGIEALNGPPTAFRSIEESFALLEQGERANSLEVIRPERRVETGYVLVKPRNTRAEFRRYLEELNIRVMWGSEFGLDDQYIRLETLEPFNIGVFVQAIGARLRSSKEETR